MLDLTVNGYYANHIHSAVDILGFTINGNYTDLIYQTVLFSNEIHIPVFTTLRHVTITNTLILLEVSHPLCVDQLYNQKNILILRLLMSYIYGAPILDVSRSHTTTQHSR